MAHLFGTILKQWQLLIQHNLYKSSHLKEVLQQLLPSVLLLLSRTDIQLIVASSSISLPLSLNRMQRLCNITAHWTSSAALVMFFTHTCLESVKPFLENAKCPLDSASCFLKCLIKPAASPFYVSSEWGDQPTVTGVGRVA